jgi:hypothetical protein
LKLAADQGDADAMALSGAESRRFDLTVSARNLRAAARKGETRAVHARARAIGMGIAFKGDREIDYQRLGAALGERRCLCALPVRVGDDADHANGLWRRGGDAGLAACCHNPARSRRLGREFERDDGQNRPASSSLSPILQRCMQTRIRISRRRSEHSQTAALQHTAD